MGTPEQGGFSRRELLGSAAAAAALGLLRCGRDAQFETQSLSQLDARSFDVCVIGSGPAGAIVAGELLRRGLRVVVLESGVALERATELGWEPNSLDTYRAESRPAYPIQATRLRALGGASNLWYGHSARLFPIDFETHDYTPRRNPWPLRQADLASWYPRAEEALRVREAPSRSVEPLRELCGDLDLELAPLQIASASRRDPRPLRAAQDLWPDLADSTGAALVTDATVSRLTSDTEGRVTGAVAQTRSGDTRRVEAERFVVACGALESARLLLLSPGPRALSGLGNASGWVGRGFGEHPKLSFVGRLPRELGVSAQAISHAHYAALKREGFGGATLSIESSRERPRELRIHAAMEMFPDRANRLTLTRDHTDLHGSPGLRLFMRFGMRDRASFEAVRKRILAIYAGLDSTDVIEEPMGWSHHQLGTCRMGEDPQRAVVDAELLVHGTRNLYLLSSAVFPTGSAAPPTLTIAALAMRLAEHLNPA